ncbi:bifunctional methionine sulfoxide reductase B/A protein [Desulfovibrio desulfuricans]|uniref:Peptide methionine sulfoxide reductase MsrA n=1 Tax=Desulfovibrio desulfuricans TaxID=876 RepID=A0A4P7UGB6_DESDE|nr:bifunctional methionine sulfoxide reductase B/A protein [Desulfovibrio desulfuricans]QCC84819.1 bifunctional methionine sulfoxide reductase B/A protein [Desulfovibrio desulfuricans]
MYQTYPMPPLSGPEADVLLRKATEPPYTGKYLDNHEAGTYICRQCGMPLYHSKDKFESGCGWPSFDTELPGAVRRVPDADGRRVEIVCANCGGHLGHVFEGEGFTDKNTRHCVNSLSMSFAPAGSDAEKAALARFAAKTGSSAAAPTATPAAVKASESPAGQKAAPGGCSATAIMAGGCFWGVEDAFQKLPGVCEAVSGYTGGHTVNPSYEDVCRGDTGHAEAVLVRYDPARVTYEQILRRFFEIHDPTQLNRQGPDWGEQYRSAVFYENAAQRAVAEKLVARLRALGYDVVTQLAPAGPFYAAEAYHQDFASRTGRGACHMSVARFTQRADGTPVEDSPTN